MSNLIAWNNNVLSVFLLYIVTKKRQRMKICQNAFKNVVSILRISAKIAEAKCVKVAILYISWHEPIMTHIRRIPKLTKTCREFIVQSFQFFIVMLFCVRHSSKQFFFRRHWVYRCFFWLLALWKIFTQKTHSFKKSVAYKFSSVCLIQSLQN